MRWLISFQLAVAGQELMKSLKMKRREIIKQMVKSVIKLMVFITLALISFLSEAQTKK
ncbi:MAG: hypothetical protein ACI9UV_002399 [Algoriphagus sp.]|jgi:hypothetical protein